MMGKKYHTPFLLVNRIDLFKNTNKAKGPDSFKICRGQKSDGKIICAKIVQVLMHNMTHMSDMLKIYKIHY